MKLILLTREDAFKKRPFGRTAQLMKRFKKMGYESKNIFDFSLRNFCFKLKEIDERDSIIISTGLKPGIFAVILGKLKKIKIIHDWTDAYAEIQKSKGIIGKILFSFIKKIENWIIKSSDYVITLSLDNKIKGKELGKNVVYIPEGIDKKLFKNADGSTIKKKFDKPIVLYVGSLISFKNVKYLIKAVDGLDCYLLIVGNGSVNNMRKIAPDNVVFIGQVDQKKVPSFIDAADICCSPSNWDGSLKLLEYAYLGKPIVAVKGRPELLFKNEIDVLIVDPSIFGLKCGIEKLLNNEKLRQKLSRNIKKFKVHDWDEIAKIYINTVKKLIG